MNASLMISIHLSCGASFFFVLSKAINPILGKALRTNDNYSISKRACIHIEVGTQSSDANKVVSTQSPRYAWLLLPCSLTKILMKYQPAVLVV